jgi:hypothetical protein
LTVEIEMDQRGIGGTGAGDDAQHFRTEAFGAQKKLSGCGNDI